MSLQIYRTARDMLMLRNDKSDLIVALAQAKTESDVARERAEAASPAKSQTGAAAPAASQTPAAPTAAPKALTPQRQKMKDCAVKWKEEKASTGAKGRTAYNKFMRGCLKKPAA